MTLTVDLDDDTSRTVNGCVRQGGFNSPEEFVVTAVAVARAIMNPRSRTVAISTYCSDLYTVDLRRFLALVGMDYYHCSYFNGCPDEASVSKLLIEHMQAARRLCSIGATCRHKAKVSTRQPLNSYLVSPATLAEYHAARGFHHLICSELNTKILESH